MARYRRKFNPEQYWANKPYCILCKKRKVKTGNICGECQKEGQWQQKTITQENADTLSKEKLIKSFDATTIQRKEAPQLVKSIIGYLKDCAAAILRTASLVDITNNNDVSFIQAPTNSLELLANGGFELKEKEAFDFLYKLASRPNEFDLILGTLVLKRQKTEQRDKSICAPLLYVKLDAAKSDDDKSVTFFLKEDTVFINQALVSSIVNVKDEEELEMRFQDLYDSQPVWPLTVDSLNQFLASLSGSFSEIFKGKVPTVEGFEDFYKTDATKTGELFFSPTNIVILLPKPEAEGTVVDELGLMFKNLLDQTALDYIFCGSENNTENFSGKEEQSIEHTFSKQEPETWHNIWPIDLSDAKKEIIFSARKNPLTVVSGPPGTGKSYTIAAVILDHLLAGKRVLFVSRMDKAVDVVVSWLENFTGPFTVARSGGRNAQRILAEKLDLLTGPNSPAKSVSKNDIDSLEKKYADAEVKIKDMERKFVDLISCEREWSKVSEFIKKTENQIKNDKDFSSLGISIERGEKMREKLKKADSIIKNKRFFLLTWWGQTAVNNIKSILNVSEDTPVEQLSVILEKIVKENKKKEIEEEINKFEEVDKLWLKIQTLDTNLHNTGREILQKSLLGNLFLITNNHQKRMDIRAFIQSLRAANLRRKMTLKKNISTETLLAAFPCWASTAGHLSQILPLEPGMFDLVIFDEASQCDLASAAPALYRGNRVLIVGDPKQLNHVVFLGKQAEFSAFAKNGVPTENQGFYRFSQRSLFDVAEDKVSQPNYLMLDEHFRSDPHIISFSNEKFYEGKLRLMTQRPVVTDNHAIEIEYVDGRRTEGTVNPKEIETIFKDIQKIISNSDVEKPTTIGILCPFRDQVDAISKELPKYLTLDQVTKHKIVIGTAHSLQGDEKDVVILSLSISPGFHHGTLHFLERPNVFNVAITRAKKKLIVISSVKKSDLPNGLLKDFFLHAESSQEKTIPLDKFDSKFEKDVADELLAKGLKVWPQYESAGFFIDLVVGDGEDFIAVECDGPSHYDLDTKQNYHDVWRQKILERAGWRFVRISYYEWENAREKCIEKIISNLAKLK